MLFDLILAIYYLSTFFFLIIKLYFIIATVVSKMFDLIAKLRIPTKQEKAEIEIHPLNLELKIRKCSV